MKFRKKPVVIDAIQFVPENFADLDDFAGDHINNTGEVDEKGLFIAEIRTLEDGTGTWYTKHIATQGDWIIKGVQGEFYACKPDIFEATYDRAETAGEMPLEKQVEWYKNMCAKYAEDRLNEGKRLQDTMATVNELMTKIFELKSELSKYQPDMGNSYNEG